MKKTKYTLEELKNLTHPYLTLEHPNADDVIVVFDELDREYTWIEHAVLLPWTTPQRLFGWVHPAAREAMRDGFTLHSAYMYHGSYAIQQTSENSARFVAGPKALLPYEFMSAVDIAVESSPTTIWMRDQGPEIQGLFIELMKKLLFPSQIEVAGPAPLPLVPNGRKV